MTQYGVLLFATTWAALRAEKVLLKEGLEVKLIPTPREYSSECGLALRFDWGQLEQVRNLLAGARVEYSSLHRLGS